MRKGKDTWKTLWVSCSLHVYPAHTGTHIHTCTEWNTHICIHTYWNTLSRDDPCWSSSASRWSLCTLCVWDGLRTKRTWRILVLVASWVAHGALCFNSRLEWGGLVGRAMGHVAEVLNNLWPSRGQPHSMATAVLQCQEGTSVFYACQMQQGCAFHTREWMHGVGVGGWGCWAWCMVIGRVQPEALSWDPGAPGRELSRKGQFRTYAWLTWLC